MVIDGTVEAQTPINYFKHFYKEFIVFVPAKASDPEKFRIRGYKTANMLNDLLVTTKSLRKTKPPKNQTTIRPPSHHNK